MTTQQTPGRWLRLPILLLALIILGFLIAFLDSRTASRDVVHEVERFSCGEGFCEASILLSNTGQPASIVVLLTVAGLSDRARPSYGVYGKESVALLLPARGERRIAARIPLSISRTHNERLDVSLRHD